MAPLILLAFGYCPRVNPLAKLMQSKLVLIARTISTSFYLYSRNSTPWRQTKILLMASTDQSAHKNFTRHITPAVLNAVIVLMSIIAYSAAHSADFSKTLRYYFEAPESGFDPAKYSDHYSAEVNSSIFEPLLDYDYLATPQTLIPNTAAQLPEIRDQGKTFIVKIKPGIYFTDDPAFNGKRRELTAKDYLYSIQRLVDPGNRGAPWDFMFKGKVIGLDAKIDAAKKTGKFNYDQPIAGLAALDRYTLQIKLVRADFNMPYILAAPATAAVAREVIEKYADDAEEHPVGTGPYKLKSWQRRNRIILEANSAYRGKTYTPPNNPDVSYDKSIAQALAGKTFPQIGTIDIRIIDESQAAWLAFEGNELDILPRMGSSYAKLVATDGNLHPKYAKRGYHYVQEAEAYLGYYQFNMDDPVVGGYELPKIALRRAIAHAYNQAKSIAIVRSGQAIAAQSPLAPQINGYDPDYRNPLAKFSPPHGNALLDLFGYKDCNGDGWRDTPDCKPLTINLMMSSGKSNRDEQELWLRGTKAMGIKLIFSELNFSDFLKNRQSGHYQMSEAAWGMDYPDAENFMQLLYGPNAGPVNESKFRNKAFDVLYEDIASTQPSAERNEKLRQMSRIVAAYVPWIVTHNILRSHLAQPWISGFRVHPSNMPCFMYLDIDKAKQQAALSHKDKQ